MYRRLEVWKALYEERRQECDAIVESIATRGVEELINDLLYQASQAQSSATVHVVADSKGRLNNDLVEFRKLGKPEMTVEELKTTDPILYYKMIADDLCPMKMSPRLRTVFRF